jgi:Domain of unknown function (DUF5615)
VKFLLDAQLPRRVAAWLAAAGCDAVHTFEPAERENRRDVQGGAGWLRTAVGVERPQTVGGCFIPIAGRGKNGNH